LQVQIEFASLFAVILLNVLRTKLRFCCRSHINMADQFKDWKQLLKLLYAQATATEPAADEAALDHIASVSSSALALVRSMSAATAEPAVPESSTGSQQAQQQGQLFGMLFSTLKLVGAGAFADVDYGKEQHADDWCVAAAQEAAAALQARWAGQHTSSAPNSSSATTGSAQPPHALAMLPWLVLFGRCCLHWHLSLQKNETFAMLWQPGQAFPPPQKPGVDWWRLLDDKSVFVCRTKSGEPSSCPCCPCSGMGGPHCQSNPLWLQEMSQPYRLRLIHVCAPLTPGKENWQGTPSIYCQCDEHDAGNIRPHATPSHSGNRWQLIIQTCRRPFHAMLYLTGCMAMGTLWPFVCSSTWMECLYSVIHFHVQVMSWKVCRVRRQSQSQHSLPAQSRSSRPGCRSFQISCRTAPRQHSYRQQGSAHSRCC
jgi:hypothetical protein